jgi:chromosome segregation ATPase
MKNQMGTIVLLLICVGLIGALIWSQKHASDQKSAAEANIGSYSNKWVETSAGLDQQRQVNTSLEGDLKKQRTGFDELTNAYTQVSTSLEQSQNSLKSSQEQVAQRDAKIADLESQNQALDQRALDLSTAITNLTAQIDSTQKKLAASEGDKAFLEKELQRLMTEKAELERQFNDLAVLRAQVSKLKEELSISRRLEWIRQGLFARAEQKGGEQLMQKNPAITNPPPRQPTYDLNVEVSSDGTVKVISPMTNNPAAATSPLPAATNTAPVH